MFTSIPELNFKLKQYHLVIHKVNDDTAYDLQFVHFVFDYHHNVSDIIYYAVKLVMQ